MAPPLFRLSKEPAQYFLAPRSNSGITPMGLLERYKGTSSPPPPIAPSVAAAHRTPQDGRPSGIPPDLPLCLCSSDTIGISHWNFALEFAYEFPMCLHSWSLSRVSAHQQLHDQRHHKREGHVSVRARCCRSDSSRLALSRRRRTPSDRRTRNGAARTRAAAARGDNGPSGWGWGGGGVASVRRGRARVLACSRRDDPDRGAQERAARAQSVDDRRAAASRETGGRESGEEAGSPFAAVVPSSARERRGGRTVVAAAHERSTITSASSRRAPRDGIGGGSVAARGARPPRRSPRGARARATTHEVRHTPHETRYEGDDATANRAESR